MNAGAVVLILVVLCAAGISIWALTLRYRRRELQHKERLAALEKGVALPDLTDVETPAGRSSRAYLLRGLIWLFAGLPLSLLLFGISISSRHPKPIQERAFEIERLKNVGASEDLIQRVQNDNTPYPEMPLGFSLAGLVPAGVGIAYLIVYRLEKKEFEAR